MVLEMDFTKIIEVALYNFIKGLFQCFPVAASRGEKKILLMFTYQHRWLMLKGFLTY